MDYRKRNYYLVTISYLSYDMRLNYYRLAAPSLKIHAPYGHFKGYDKDYDGVCMKELWCSGYWQIMLSCKKEDSEALEYELRKAERNDNGNSYFIKLDKCLLGQ